MILSLRGVLVSLSGLFLILAANLLIFNNAMRPERIIAIYAAVVLVQLLFAAVQRREAVSRDGWRFLWPGHMEWCGLVGGIGLTGLFVYVYLFVGSTRADAATQMVVLRLLILAFGVMTILVFFGSFVAQVRWNDEGIERRTLLGKKSSRWDELAAAGPEWSGYLFVESARGVRVRFSPYQNGAAELIAFIETLRPAAPPRCGPASSAGRDE